jgi:hypothetical protein
LDQAYKGIWTKFATGCGPSFQGFWNKHSKGFGTGCQRNSSQAFKGI